MKQHRRIYYTTSQRAVARDSLAVGAISFELEFMEKRLALDVMKIGQALSAS